jgi:hypothetical protein
MAKQIRKMYLACFCKRGFIRIPPGTGLSEVLRTSGFFVSESIQQSELE